MASIVQDTSYVRSQSLHGKVGIISLPTIPEQIEPIEGGITNPFPGTIVPLRPFFDIEVAKKRLGLMLAHHVQGYKSASRHLDELTAEISASKVKLDRIRTHRTTTNYRSASYLSYQQYTLSLVIRRNKDSVALSNLGRQCEEIEKLYLLITSEFVL